MTYKVVTMSSRTGDIPADVLRSSTIEMQSFDDLAQEIQLKEESKQKIYTLGKSYDTVSGKIVTMTEKTKEEEKGGQPSGLEAFQRMESVKIIPAMTEYEVLEAIADEKSKRGPEVQTPKRRLSESLAPIKEAESRRPSPEEEPLPKAQMRAGDAALHVGLEGVRWSKAEQAPEGEALKVGLFGPRRKSLSEWRYSQDPAFSVTTAHYLTQSAASRVVVTSAFRLGRRFRFQHDVFEAAPFHPEPFRFSCCLALCSEQPTQAFYFRPWLSRYRSPASIKTLCVLFPAARSRDVIVRLWLAMEGKTICLNQHRPTPSNSLLYQTSSWSPRFAILFPILFRSQSLW